MFVTTPDIYTLSGRHDGMLRAVRAALDATVRFRGVEMAPLSSVVDDLAELRAELGLERAARKGAA